MVLLGDATHCWEVVYLLKPLELVQFITSNGHIVPYDVDIRLPCQLIFHELLFLLLGELLLTVFLFLVFAFLNRFLFLRADDLPLHFEGYLAQDLVLGVREVNPDLASIEYVPRLSSLVFLWRRLRVHNLLVGGCFFNSFRLVWSFFGTLVLLVLSMHGHG